MKRNLLIIALIALALTAYSCGGGAGTTNVPTGENPGRPSVVQLLPVQSVAQTGSYIYLKAKVLDGNGMVVPNVAVIFKNVTPAGIGVLHSWTPTSTDTAKSVTATTDGLGVATATLLSTSQGFIDVEALVPVSAVLEVPAAQLRSCKTLYYTDTCDINWPTTATTATPVPYFVMNVDSNNNGTYNETSDITIYENSSDTQASIQAILYSGSGAGVVSNGSVTFSADSTEVTFNPSSAIVKTNTKGEAYITALFKPSVIRTSKAYVNIQAAASSGSPGLVTIQLNPITVGKIELAAAPTVVKQDGKVTITANVTTTIGTIVPDGTSVMFSAPVCGSVIPFATTTSGQATAAFTAPSSNTSCSVTAASGGIGSTVNISVYTDPTVVAPDTISITPGSVTVVSGASAQTVSFTIAGGYGPYTTTSSDPGKVYNSTPGNGVWTNTPVMATIAPNAAAGTVTLNTYDSKGNTKSTTLTIMSGGATTGGALTVSPAAITLTGIAEPPADTKDDVTFKITGGTPPYSMYSDNAAVIANGGSIAGSTYTIDPTAVSANKAVTLTFTDSLGASSKVTATITPATGVLAVNPATLSVRWGTASYTFSILGGLNAGYTVISGNQTYVTINGGISAILPAGTTTFTVGITNTQPCNTAVPPVCTTVAVPITVIDTAGGASTTSTVTVNP